MCAISESRFQCPLIFRRQLLGLPRDLQGELQRSPVSAQFVRKPELKFVRYVKGRIEVKLYPFPDNFSIG